MKILAIEKELKTVDWENESQTLIEGAKSAYKCLRGIIDINYRARSGNAYCSTTKGEKIHPFLLNNI